MGTVLGTLAELGYGYAYRVLDAEYFGVAQRRRRVFIVGCFGDWVASAKVLFEPESCEGDTPPSRKTGQDIARALTSSVGGVSGKEQQATYVYQCHGGNVGPTGGLTGRVPFVAHTLRAEGHDASEDGLGRQMLIPVVAATLSSSHSPEGRHGGRMMNDDVNLVAIQDVRGGTEDKHAVAAPITASYGKQVDNSDRNAGPPNILVDLIARPLRANRWGGSDSHGDEGNVVLDAGVRRLTPTECERLQGFPDGWTALDGKAADSPRYRALGNAVCVPVVEWIGKRIMGVDHEIRSAKGDRRSRPS